MTDDYIWIVTDAVPSGEPTGGRGNQALPNPFDQQATPAAVSDRPGIPVAVEKLEQGMADFLDKMGRVLKQAQVKAKDVGDMELDEIEISVEVNGEGQLSLFGSGTKVGGKGALTLKFKRSVP